MCGGYVMPLKNKPRNKVAVQRVRIHRQWWTVRLQQPRDPTLVGECDISRRVVRVAPTLTHTETLATAIHETLHALLPEWDEPNVEAATRSMIHVLGLMNKWKLPVSKRTRRQRA